MSTRTQPDDPRVQVVVTPPSEESSPGNAELRAIGEAVEPPDINALADRPWLRQDAPERGCALQTVGLEVHAAHPELALTNMPTALVESGIALLRRLATYVLAGGRLDDESFMQLDEGLPSLLAFRPVSDEDAPDAGALRVVFLA